MGSIAYIKKDELASLHAEVERLRAALQPFARMADEADNFGGGASFIDMRISVAELHSAREAFAVEQDVNPK